MLSPGEAGALNPHPLIKNPSSQSAAADPAASDPAAMASYVTDAGEEPVPRGGNEVVDGEQHARGQG
jgi:hypothetical protein